MSIYGLLVVGLVTISSLLLLVASQLDGLLRDLITSLVLILVALALMLAPEVSTYLKGINVTPHEKRVILTMLEDCRKQGWQPCAVDDGCERVDVRSDDEVVGVCETTPQSCVFFRSGAYTSYLYVRSA